MIIQYRLQVFGGLGALTGLFSYLVNDKIKDEKIPYVRAFISTALLIVLLAAAFLDIFYYQKLLSGSVDAILELERIYPNINMSTLIAKKANSIVVTVVYSVVALIMLFFSSWSWWRFSKSR